MSQPQHLIAGALVAGRGATSAHPCPMGRGLLSETREPDADQVEAALAAGVAALAAGERLSQDARAEILLSLAARLEADTEALAGLAVAETGCPAAQAAALHVGAAVGVLRAGAGLARAHRFAERRPAARGGETLILKRPVGLAVGIVPWNVPLYLAAAKIMGAVAGGTPLILKPSPETAGLAARLAGHLAESGLPAGMVQLLLGGRDLGRRLVADRWVAKVSFTGSAAAGEQVAAAAAPAMKRLTLELGGKSAAILLDDVDLPAVRRELFLAMLQNNGQVCGAQSRLLVPDRRCAELLDGLADMFATLAVADPRLPTTDIGPLATAAQQQRAHALVGAGRAAGARIIAEAREVPETGCFVRPALVEAEPGNPLAREEVFGPVVVVHSYRTLADAIRIANASDYGLSGSVWSADTERALEVAAQLRTGTVGINSKRILDFAAPFGGWRRSGFGRELGPEGIDAFTETTTILLPGDTPQAA